MTAGFAMLVASGTIYLDWRHDGAILRQQAVAATKNTHSRAEAVVALNHWVYGHEGFAKNHGYFLLKALGPTPLQVLRSGGDCSDKSRLLSAMLFQIGIRSGLVMIYPCADCGPIHTVVEAEYERGRMVVDPIWNIDYPAAEGGYYGVRELAGTALGRDRLISLKKAASASAKIAAMPASEATFDYARGVNWNKHALMRSGASLLQYFEVNPAFVLRPRVLEDPKLAIWSFLLTAALLLVTAAAVLSLAIKAAARSSVLEGAAGGQLGNNVAELS